MSFSQFTSNSAALHFIRERADDIELAAIPRGMSLEVPSPHNPSVKVAVETGLALRFLDGSFRLLSISMADAVLEDGILSRLRIPLCFFQEPEISMNEDRC